MKLIESDPTLAGICRLVEVRLQDVSCVATVEIPVVLLGDFNHLGYPVTPRDPVAYNRSGHKILVNAQAFPSFSGEAAQFALAHEIGHHADHTGIAGSLLGSKGIHPCLIADWLAVQWGFAEEMRMERLADRGPEFCEKLSTISAEEELLRWAAEWEPRFRMARLLGQNIAPPKLRP
jgi:hypothetical protein